MIAKNCSGCLCHKIALSIGQHLVANHKFPNCRGSQQRGVEVGVKLPKSRSRRQGRSPVPPHRIRELCLEQISIPRAKPLEDIGKGCPLIICEVRQTRDMAFWHHKRLERQCRQVGNHSDPVNVLNDSSRDGLQLALCLGDPSRMITSALGDLPFSWLHRPGRRTRRTSSHRGVARL